MNDGDRISDLPDAVSSHILSFLSTKEAVGTSILSKKWRYLFALLPNLDFELHDCPSSANILESSTIKSFLSLVDRVLLFHNMTNIGKFRSDAGKRLILSAAVRRGVNHLDLNISLYKNITLPGVLFTCGTLTTLKLDIPQIVLGVPQGVNFPNLKSIHLKSVEFLNDDSVKSLLSSCTSLEEMVIQDYLMMNISNLNISHHLPKGLTILFYPYLGVVPHHWLMIDTPNLTYFKYSGPVFARYSLENLQSLFKADINILDPFLQADATAFFRAICNVHSLSLLSAFLEVLLGCKPRPVFATLVELEIRYDPRWSSCGYSYYWKNGLETLLTSCCELEKLALYQEILCSLPENTSLLSKLKVIEISNFKDDKVCIGKAKYILKNSGALQKLIILTALDISEEKKLKLYEELLATSPRKSKQCCILIV